MYEPTSSMDQTIIIPLSRRTEEVFGGVYNQMINSSILQSNGTQRNNSQRFDGRERETQNDIAMQNVLSWSTAKNYNPNDIPNFRRTHSYLSNWF